MGIKLIPAKERARDWKLGQCVGQVTEEYAEFIMVNRDRVRALAIHADDDDIANLTKRELVEETIDLMTACRTLLWKLGLDDDDVASAVEKVNAKNRARGYLA